MKELEITRAVRDSAWTNLRSSTFDSKHYATRVLRRISVELGQDPRRPEGVHDQIEASRFRGLTVFGVYACFARLGLVGTGRWPGVGGALRASRIAQ